MREPALAALEKARQAKLIGKSLDAKLVWTVGKESENSVKGLMEIWRELFNVSEIQIIVTERGEDSSMVVEKANGQKCERCWHWETDIGHNPAHPTICARCTKAVLEFKATS